MAKVQLLEKTVAERIAAGEVVDRPCSVIKELTENSLDADSKHITVEIRKGGLEMMRITDDGFGMSSEDVQLAVQRFATSKINKWEDLDSLITLGFRGEALPSIAAVSRLEIRTVLRGAQEGTLLKIAGAGEPEITACPAVEGTRITVQDLFYNTPARLKFMRSAAAEASQIIDLLSKMAAAWSQVSFKLISNGKEVFSYPIGLSVTQRLSSLWKIPSEDFLPVYNETSGVILDGFIALPKHSKNNRNCQLLVMNGRIIRSQTLSQAMFEGYAPLIDRGRFPVGMLRLTVNPSIVDVNVHPTKMEVRFVDQRPIFSLICRTIADSLQRYQADSVNLGHFAQSVELPLDTDEEMGKERKALQLSLSESVNTDFNPQIQSSFNQQNSDNTGSFVEPESKPKDRTFFDEDAVMRSFKQASYGRRDLSGYKLSDNVASYESFPSQVGQSFANTVPQEDQLSKDNGIFAGQSQDNCANAPGEQISKASIPNSLISDGNQSDLLLLPPEPKKRFKYFGQLFNTYLVGTLDGELWVVDQHTAHERINYERFSAVNPLNPASQHLAVPFTIELTPSQSAFVNENMASFEEFGFQIEEFGNNTIKLRTLPLGLKEKKAISAFKDLIDELVTNSVSLRNTVKEKFREEIRARLSCKAAVKAGDPLEDTEAQNLVEELLQNEHCLYCPHGRPTRIKLDKKLLEKLFHRT